MLPSLSFPGSEVGQLVCRTGELRGRPALITLAGFPPLTGAFPAFGILPRTAENEQIPGEWFLFFIAYFIFQQILWFL